MKKYQLEIEIRPASTKNDLDYIYSTFVRSQHNQWPWRARTLIDATDKKRVVRDGVDKNYFCASAHSIMTRMLRNGETLMASLPGDDDQIFGYIIFSKDPRVLFYNYTKWDFRKAGVGTRLMLAAFGSFDKKIDYVIKTGAIRHLERKWHLSYNSHHLTGLGRQDIDWK